MSNSIARLVASRGVHGTRIVRAYSAIPQRWVLARQGCDEWAEVTHQLVGDGVFGGDNSRTTIRVSAGASLLVRGVAVTPLRRQGPSSAATRLKVASGGSLIHVPGALVPHARSASVSSVRIEADAGARVLAAQILVPGRSGMGEIGQFTRLRLRTTAFYARQLALFEDLEVEPEGLSGRAVFGVAEAHVSIVLLGCDDDIAATFSEGSSTRDSLVASNPLRHNGFAIRGLFANLSDAQELVTAMADKARAGWPQKAASSADFVRQLVC